MDEIHVHKTKKSICAHFAESPCTWLILSVLNDRVVTGCLRPSPTNHLTVFSNVQPSGL